MQYKIGVIGAGFVGKAVASGFALHAQVKIYDKIESGYNSLKETVNDSKFLFVCVPSPMKDDGSQDLSNIKDALEAIEKNAQDPKIIILKSTLLPGTTRSCSLFFPRHSFVFNPEFLTQRTANFDFINPARIILGGIDPKDDSLCQVEALYRKRFTSHLIFKTTWEAAELVKYMANCFFSTKIAFCNEFYDLAQSLGIDYDELRDMWLADGRIANSHTDVPGHDGYRGYGGKCFPKDVQALIRWAKEKGYNVDMCEAAEGVNARVREVKDWEEIKGATSKNNY